MEKVIRDGKVAIIFSYGFNTGWYSWNAEHEELIFSPKIVKMIEEERQSEIDNEWIEKELGIPDVYCGGAENLQILWLEKGTAFIIEEYDGAESVKTLEDLTIIA